MRKNLLGYVKSVNKGCFIKLEEFNNEQHVQIIDDESCLL